MNLLDYIIIIIIAYLLIKGVLRGFVREISSLAGIILGIWLGNLFQPQVTEFLRPYLPSVQYLPLISFAVLFALILGLCNILGWAISLLCKKIFLGGIDRLLGAGLAILKGVIITYLIIVILTFFIPSKTPLISSSRLAPWVIRSYQFITGFISPGHYQNLKERFLGEKNMVAALAPEKSGGTLKGDE